MIGLYSVGLHIHSYYFYAKKMCIVGRPCSYFYIIMKMFCVSRQCSTLYNINLSPSFYTYYLQAYQYNSNMIRLPSVRSVWKVIFAITAALELQYIILLMRRVDDTKHDSDEYCQSTLVYVEDNEFSINYTFIDRAWESTITISQLVFVWTGPLFCALCIIEALVRAVEARRAALHNRALDDFERSVLRMAQQSSVRLSMFFRGSTHDQGHTTKNISTVSKVMRSWFPPVATIAFWLFILPTDVADFHHRCGSDRLHDSAVVTQWMKSLSLYISNLVVSFHTLV